MNRIKNTKAEISVELLIKILLALVILVVVFFFLFGNYIWDYIRNLPGGNKYDNKDSIIENVSKDNKIIAEYYKVGVIANGEYIQLCTNGNCNALRESKIYIRGDIKSAILYADINWGFDQRVGSILNNKIKIDEGVIAKNDIYESVKGLVSYEDLMNLDNSLFISGILLREKKWSE